MTAKRRDWIAIYQTSEMTVAPGGIGSYRAHWRWRRNAANGRILCQGQAHTRRRDAARAALRANPDLDRTDIVNVDDWIDPEVDL